MRPFNTYPCRYAQLAVITSERSITTQRIRANSSIAHEIGFKLVIDSYPKQLVILRGTRSCVDMPPMREGHPYTCCSRVLCSAGMRPRLRHYCESCRYQGRMQDVLVGDPMYCFPQGTSVVVYKRMGTIVSILSVTRPSTLNHCLIFLTKLSSHLPDTTFQRETRRGGTNTQQGRSRSDIQRLLLPDSAYSTTSLLNPPSPCTVVFPR